MRLWPRLGILAILLMVLLGASWGCDMARSYTLRGLTAANGLALVNVWCRAFNATTDALVETAYTDSSGEASFSALPDDANVNICCIPGVKGDTVTWLYNVFSAAQDLSYGEIIVQSAQIKDAIITSAKIGTLDASKITSGYISAARLDATVAYISATAMIANAIITDAKITTCSIGKLTAGELNVAGTIVAGGKFVTGAAGTNRIEITNTIIAGLNSSNVIQFALQASDGKAYCGAGAVILDATGIKIYGQYLYLYSGATPVGVLVAGNATTLTLGSNYDIVIQAGSGRTIAIGSSGTTYQLTLDTVFYPYTNGVVNLGRSDRKWWEVHGIIFRPTSGATGGIIMPTVAKAETGSYKYSWNGSLLTMAIYCGGSWHHIS